MTKKFEEKMTSAVKHLESEYAAELTEQKKLSGTGSLTISSGS